MGNINMAILSGRVGQDPEVKIFDSGAMKSSFSLATTKKWTTKEGEKKEETQWHRIETWGGLTTLVEGWVKKGTMLVVHGEIAYEKYTDKEGVERHQTKIRAHSIDIGSSSGGAAESTGPASQPAAKTNFPAADDDDDLPF